MQLAPQQQQALDSITTWYNNPDSKPAYYLGGWAGTGKTSIAMPVAEALAGSAVIFAAFTGKAAYVLQERGCAGAATMHSVIYHSGQRSLEAAKAMRAERATAFAQLQADNYTDEEIELHPKITILDGKILEEERNARKPLFRKNPDSRLLDAKLGVLDEVSMVNEQMARDWLSYGVKTLVLGDPAQLPPVMGEGFFTRHAPNFMLTEIHRQAEGNPIIYLATLLRQQEQPQPGDYGSSKVVNRSKLTKPQLADMMLAADQIIVGENKTRHSFNNRIRELRGFKTSQKDSCWPQAGERVVCLRNNAEKGLLNGSLYNVVKLVDAYPEIDRVDLILSPAGESDRQTIEVHCHAQHFLGQEDALNKMWYSKKEAEEFDFGYALTCHKSQGSQFKNPLIWDESYVARDKRFNWKYTAVTRAQESVTHVL